MVTALSQLPRRQEVVYTLSTHLEVVKEHEYVERQPEDVARVVLDVVRLQRGAVHEQDSRVPHELDGPPNHVHLGGAPAPAQNGPEADQAGQYGQNTCAATHTMCCVTVICVCPSWNLFDRYSTPLKATVVAREETLFFLLSSSETRNTNGRHNGEENLEHSWGSPCLVYAYLLLRPFVCKTVALA